MLGGEMPDHPLGMHDILTGLADPEPMSVIIREEFPNGVHHESDREQSRNESTEEEEVQRRGCELREVSKKKIEVGLSLS
jgi:hypothetical protein